MNEINIKRAQQIFREIVHEEYRGKYLDLSANPIQYGYNIFNSYRAGGKTTNDLIFMLICYHYFGKTSMYCRSGARATRAKAVSTLCTAMNTTVDDTGRNYVQRCTNDAYTWIEYHSNTKTFRLQKTPDDEIKKCPIFMYVTNINDDAMSLKSGFADNNCDIMLYDEFIDDETNAYTVIKFLNLISTVFRLRHKTIAIMNCNLSVGSPVILRTFGIYEKVLNQTTPFMIYHTKAGMKIAVTCLETKDEFNNDRSRMNETYFNFDTHIDGLENIRGASICHESYRELPPDIDEKCTVPTGLYYYSCGQFFEVYQIESPTWQSMYFIKTCIEPVHDREHLTITDDKLYAFDNPYTYASIGRDFKICCDVARKVRRNDVCFDDFMAYVCIKSFYDLYKIPELI